MKIQVQNLTKVIHGVTILNDVTITMESGKIYGLRGKNGSGKTMFMRCLCGLILPTSGDVEIDGKRIGKEMDFPESAGVLIENPSFLNAYTGFQNLQLLAQIKGVVTDDGIKEAMRKVGLDPEDKRKYRKYSLGMKQKLGVACALMESPDLILLDEPINALDQKSVERVKAYLMELKEKGKLIVVACHNHEELEYLSDEIFLVEEGKITREE